MRAVALALALAGCGADTAFLSTDGLAAVILVETTGPVTRATLHDLRAEPLLRRTAEAELSYALGYVAPPSLPAGALELVPSGRPLPAPDRIHALSEGEWRALPALPAELSALRTPADECWSFELVTRTLPARASTAAPLDGLRVFIAAHDRRFYVVTPDAVTPVTSLSTTTPYRASFERDGEIFLVGPGARFFRGHPDRGFVEGPRLARGLAYDAYLAGSTEGPLELYATDGSMALQRFDGERWELLRESARLDELSRPRVAWLERGRVAIVGSATSELIELAAGDEHPVHLDLETFPRVDSLWHVATLPGLGSFAGTQEGAVFERVDRTWTKRALPSAAARVELFVPIAPDRFLAGGRGSVFVQHGPGALVCPPSPAVGVFDTSEAAPVVGGAAFFSGREESGYQVSYALRAN